MPTNPAASRGRRNPRLIPTGGAPQHEQDEASLMPAVIEEDSDQDSQIEPYLAGTDTVVARASVSFKTSDGSDNWTSYGVVMRVQDGETEPEAFQRAALITTLRSQDLADALANQLEERIAEEAAARRHRPLGLR